MSETLEELEISQQLIDAPKHTIRSPLLAGALSYQSCVGKAYESPFKRGIADCRANGDGYRFLVLTLRLALGVARYPGFEDRSMLALGVHGDDEFYAGLRWDDVEQAVDELSAAYHHTQTVLREIFPSGTVPLVRGLKAEYATYVAAARYVAEQDGIQTLSFLVDQLESYSHQPSPSGGYVEGAEGREVYLRREVDIEDVLLCHHTTRLVHDTAVERGEWLVINRSPLGGLTLRIDEVVTPARFEYCLRSWVERERDVLDRITRGRTTPAILVSMAKTIVGEFEHDSTVRALPFLIPNNIGYLPPLEMPLIRVMQRVADWYYGRKLNRVK